MAPEDGFYRAHNKIILSKKGVSLNYHRLDSFGFGENSQSEHIDYFEFEFPAALLFEETLPKTTFVKIGRGENSHKGTETSSGKSVYLQQKFDLIPYKDSCFQVRGRSFICEHLNNLIQRQNL